MNRLKSIRRGFSLLPSSSKAVGCKTRMGFSLIESAIVLGVVGLVIAGIWVAAASIQENNRFNQTLNGILLMIENIRSSYKGMWPAIVIKYDDAESLLIAREVGKLGKQDGFSEDGGDIYNPYGGKNLILPEINHNWGSNFPDGTPLLVVWVAVNNPTLCIKLVSAISSRFQGNGELLGVALPVNDSIAIKTFPIMPTKAQCDINGWSNTLGFYFNP